MSARTSRRVAGATLLLFAMFMLLASFMPWPTVDGAHGDMETQSGEGSAAQMGRDLFLAKGCVACHRHDDVPGAEGGIGPNLTHYVPDPDFVRDWLRDPRAIRPYTMMPDLELGEEEIEALIAFLGNAAP